MAGVNRLLCQRPHSIVSGVMFNFGEAKVLHERRNIHREATTKILLQAVPTANWVYFGASPVLDRAFFRFLILVLAAKQHPVVMLLQH